MILGAELDHPITVTVAGDPVAAGQVGASNVDRPARCTAGASCVAGGARRPVPAVPGPTARPSAGRRPSRGRAGHRQGAAGGDRHLDAHLPAASVSHPRPADRTDPAVDHRAVGRGVPARDQPGLRRRPVHQDGAGRRSTPAIRSPASAPTPTPRPATTRRRRARCRSRARCRPASAGRSPAS